MKTWVPRGVHNAGPSWVFTRHKDTTNIHTRETIVSPQAMTCPRTPPHTRHSTPVRLPILFPITSLFQLREAIGLAHDRARRFPRE